MVNPSLRISILTSRSIGFMEHHDYKIWYDACLNVYDVKAQDMNMYDV